MNHILQEDARDILKQDISWENFDGKRILVTGAGGMLGSYISRTILQWKEISGNDLELYALVRHPEKLPEDVRNQVKVLRQSVAEPIQTDVDFHYIIHAASPASPTDHARRSDGDDCCKYFGCLLHPGSGTQKSCRGVSVYFFS